MPIPDYQTLMLPVLRLAAEGDERRVAEVASRIAEEFGLSEAECGELLPSGRQSVLHNRIHWAKFYMSKAGLVASPARGRLCAGCAGPPGREPRTGRSISPWGCIGKGTRRLSRNSPFPNHTRIKTPGKIFFSALARNSF